MAAPAFTKSTYDPAKRYPLTETIPLILGSGDTVITTQTCNLKRYRIVNPSNSGKTITVSIRDGQGTPVYVMPASPLPPGAVASENMPDDGDPCVGGIVVNASDAGLHGYVKAGVTP